MNDLPFREMVSTWMASQAYQKLKIGSPEESRPESVRSGR